MDSEISSSWTDETIAALFETGGPYAPLCQHPSVRPVLGDHVDIAETLGLILDYRWLHMMAIRGGGLQAAACIYRAVAEHPSMMSHEHQVEREELARIADVLVCFVPEESTGRGRLTSARKTLDFDETLMIQEEKDDKTAISHTGRGAQNVSGDVDNETCADPHVASGQHQYSDAIQTDSSQGHGQHNREDEIASERNIHDVEGLPSDFSNVNKHATRAVADAVCATHNQTSCGDPGFAHQLYGLLSTNLRNSESSLSKSNTTTNTSTAVSAIRRLLSSVYKTAAAPWLLPVNAQFRLLDLEDCARTYNVGSSLFCLCVGGLNRQVVAVGLSEGRVGLFSLDSDEKPKVLSSGGATESVLSLSFSSHAEESESAAQNGPRRDILAAAHYDGSIRLWDMSSLTVVDELPSSGMRPEEIRVSSDGRRVVVWEEEEETMLMYYKDAERDPGDGSWEKLQISGCSNSLVFGIATNTLLKCPIDSFINPLPNQAFLLAFKLHTVSLYTSDKAISWLMNDPETTVFGNFARYKLPSGQEYLVSIVGPTDNGPQSIRIVDARNGCCISDFEVATDLQNYYMLVASWLPFREEALVVTGHTDGTLKIRRLTDGSLVRQFRAHRLTISGLGFDVVGNRIISCSRDGTIRLWPIPSLGEEKQELASVSSVASHGKSGQIPASLHRGAVHSLFALECEPVYVSCASYDPLIRIWSADNGKCLNHLRIEELESANPIAVSVSADGGRIVCVGTCSYDDNCFAYYWNMKRDLSAHSVVALPGTFSFNINVRECSIAFARNGTLLAAVLSAVEMEHGKFCIVAVVDEEEIHIVDQQIRYMPVVGFDAGHEEAATVDSVVNCRSLADELLMSYMSTTIPDHVEDGSYAPSQRTSNDFVVQTTTDPPRIALERRFDVSDPKLSGSHGCKFGGFAFFDTEVTTTCVHHRNTPPDGGPSSRQERSIAVGLNDGVVAVVHTVTS